MQNENGKIEGGPKNLIAIVVASANPVRKLESRFHYSKEELTERRKRLKKKKEHRQNKRKNRGKK